MENTRDSTVVVSCVSLRGPFAARRQAPRSQEPFGTHHVQDVHTVFIQPVKDADDSASPSTPGAWNRFRDVALIVQRAEHSADQLLCCFGIV